jgi:hypothetical protein
MEWVRILAYITGTVDQELFLRNEHLAAEIAHRLGPQRSEKLTHLYSVKRTH